MNDYEASPPPGEIIAGKYRVERELGKGGMGIVVAAVHVELDQRVAIKILREAAMDNPESVARFLREAKAAARIRSENVARVMDIGTLDDGRAYIVMEHLDGTDLADVLHAEGALPLDHAVDLTLEVCAAMATAHAAGIVHRDLKPANLFLAQTPDRTSVLKVLDFGVSKLVNVSAATKEEASITQTGQIFGSPAYMSPEQLRGDPVDARTDIWSIGVVLYQLLSGDLPFRHSSFAEILAAAMRDPAPKLTSKIPDLPAEVDAILERCLEKDPEHRYPNVGELAQALAPFGSKRGEEAAERVARIMSAAETTLDGHPPITPARLSSPGSAPRSKPSDPGSGPKSAARPSDAAMGAAHTQASTPVRGARSRSAVLVGAALVVGALGILIATQRPPAQANHGVVSAAVEGSAAVSAAPAPPAMVTITISDAPPGTRVLDRGTLIGTVPGVIRLLRGDAPKVLRFEHDGYSPAEITVSPTMDRLLGVSLSPLSAAAPKPPSPSSSSPPPAAPAPSGRPAKPRVNDLEPF